MGLYVSTIISQSGKLYHVPDILEIVLEKIGVTTVYILPFLVHTSLGGNSLGSGFVVVVVTPSAWWTQRQKIKLSLKIWRMFLKFLSLDSSYTEYIYNFPSQSFRGLLFFFFIYISYKCGIYLDSRLVHREPLKASRSQTPSFDDQVVLV